MCMAGVKNVKVDRRRGAARDMRTDYTVSERKKGGKGDSDTEKGNIKKTDIEFRGRSLLTLAKLLAQFCDTVDVESSGCKVTLGNTKESVRPFFLPLVKQTAVSLSVLLPSSHSSDIPLVSNSSTALHFPLSVVHTIIISLALPLMNKHKGRHTSAHFLFSASVCLMFSSDCLWCPLGCECLLSMQTGRCDVRPFSFQ